jgi:pyruvate/2-oxoglutarate dehydrogenase complex dihydrolipoamide acyltransferase (E2) component
VAKNKNKNRQGAHTPPEERVEADLVEGDFQTEPFNPDAEEAGFFDEEVLDEQTDALMRAGAPHGSVIQTPPSAYMNPYVPEEEQGMDMKPVIVGPPAFGSPDPLTSAGALLPLEQHPLRTDALPEGHPSAISEDYGDGYDVTLRGAQTVTQQSRVPTTDLQRHAAGDFTKEELETANAEVDATDGAYELAMEEGVNLNDVEGTGEEGRVTKSDVENFLTERNNGDNA